MRIVAVLLLTSLLLLGGLAAGCKSKKKMPAMNQVEMVSKQSAAPAFDISTTQAQNTNGKVNVAVVSKQGSMIQVNDLPLTALKAGKVAGDAYRLVYLPGGMQPACLGNQAKNRLTLKQLADNQWEMWLRGEISCEAQTLELNLRTTFELPAPTFVAPNQP